ncbi:hypothetical protein BGP77_07335 [Saccharospirillum sp. MSK14-1]|uniref:hypothetical protein n=1 Tax=Saccharospirillum sp. MSK14-1 TaxID=1897632 RepID=UPI000D3C5D22|nr:hypothetical protein [Saccharospirillum sp. MSK14-1]PTY37085.1 hypothetical protein BGP77_07335 [Saccharospirillum sp. MSK14-1]
MKLALWWFYSTLLIVFITFGLFQALTIGQLTLGVLLNVALNLLCLVGVYGYVYEKPIFKRTLWIFLFWFRVISVVLSVLLLAVYPINVAQRSAEMLFNVVLIVPLLYALFRYGSINNPIWGVESQENFVAVLKRKLGSADDIETVMISNEPDGQLKTTLRISKSDSGYLIRIEKEVAGKTEAFSSELANIHQLARFLQHNTLARAADFS